MFLKWENNSGKFQNNAINDVNKFHWAMWLNDKSFFKSQETFRLKQHVASYIYWF